MIMTQDEYWLVRYNKVMNFMHKDHRNPSHYRLEEHDMLNWLKVNRKKMNAGELKEDRVVAFEKLLTLCEQYKRKNQYQ